MTKQFYFWLFTLKKVCTETCIHTHTHTHTLKNLHKEIQSSFIHDIQKQENSPGVHFTVVEWLKIQWCLPQQKTTQQEKWTNSWYIQKCGWLSKSLSYVKKKKALWIVLERKYLPVDLSWKMTLYFIVSLPQKMSEWFLLLHLTGRIWVNLSLVLR